jgi:capsid protein
MPKKTRKTKAVNAQPRKQANGSAWNFRSTTSSTNRSVIYGTANDFSLDFTPYDRREMVKRLRYGERNVGLVRQIISDFVTYVVGDGITHQSNCADPVKAALYEDYFREKQKKASLCGRFSGAEVQRIALRRALVDGDCFVLKVIDPQTGEPKQQIVEGHRVENPEDAKQIPGLVDGVRFDSVGRLRSYYIKQGDKSAKEVQAGSVCHIFEADYASGSRGLPILQHSWTDIQSEDELLKLEMLAVRNDADFTRVLQKQGGFVTGDLKNELGGTTGSESLASRLGGKLAVLEPGESLTSLESKRPNGNFVEFLRAIQMDIGRGTLPYEFFGDSSRLGGSGLRLIAAKADRVFGRWQTILIEKLCQPTYEFIIADGISKGLLPDAPDWFKVTFTTPKRLTVDAGRDAAQERADLEMGLVSFSESYAAKGQDFKTEVTKRADDIVFLKELAEAKGIPLWMLYKPGFNWLQKGEGKPTAAEMQAEQMEESSESEMEDEPPSQEESDDEPGS